MHAGNCGIVALESGYLFTKGHELLLDVDSEMVIVIPCTGYLTGGIAIHIMLHDNNLHEIRWYKLTCMQLHYGENVWPYKFIYTCNRLHV